MAPKARKHNRKKHGGNWILLAALAMTPEPSLLASDIHFDDAPSSSEDASDFQIPDDFFQMGIPDSAPRLTSEASLGPSRSLEMPRTPKTVPRDDQGRLKAPPVFARAAFLYQAGFAPNAPAATAQAAASATATVTPQKTGYTQRSIASVAERGSETATGATDIELTGGPKTEELTREALAAEARFEKTSRARRKIPGTYSKILSALEGSTIVADRIDSEEETMTPEERKAKRLAKKSRPRKK